MNDLIDNNLKTTPQQQVPLPNSTGVLVLGILSLVMVGILGIILGIIALGISAAPNRAYKMEPDKYTSVSIGNFKGGKTCAIVGVCLYGTIILVAAILSAAGKLD